MLASRNVSSSCSEIRGGRCPRFISLCQLLWGSSAHVECSLLSRNSREIVNLSFTTFCGYMYDKATSIRCLSVHHHLKNQLLMLSSFHHSSRQTYVDCFLHDLPALYIHHFPVCSPIFKTPTLLIWPHWFFDLLQLPVQITEINL